MEKNHKKAKESCQIALFSLKTGTESPSSFDLQSCVKTRLYKLGCKCMTALLTVTETRLKDPRYYMQNKRLHKFL